MQKTNVQPRLDQSAAVRHAVYRDLLGFLRVASFDQARRFAANLSLCNAGDEAVRERQFNAAMIRFLLLKVTPDIAETGLLSGYRINDRGQRVPVGPQSRSEIEWWMNFRYGSRLADVPGFYLRNMADRPSTINTVVYGVNLPKGCAVYGYVSDTGFYRGILFQPLTRPNSFFLLSSAKYGGPKAIRLTPRDEQYFTQHEEVN